MDSNGSFIRVSDEDTKIVDRNEVTEIDVRNGGTLEGNGSDNQRNAKGVYKMQNKVY